jgi:uncharacterized protein
MPLPGLIFRTDPLARPAFTARADVAVFAGLVPRRTTTPVPASLRQWLEQAGWALSAHSRPATARPDAQVETLLDVPVPIDDWGVFDALFAWERRLLQAGGTAMLPCALGAAVRAFFAEGGRRCYVVRCGDPPPLLAATGDSRTARALLLAWGPTAPPDGAARRPILPGYASRGLPASAADPTTWHGAAHVLGIDEAAMLLLPDLPDLLTPDPAPLPPPPAPPPVPEQFVTCAPVAAAAADAPPPVLFAAPRLDLAGYRGWATALRFTLDLLANAGAAQRRDVMLLTGVPLPASGPTAPSPAAEAWPLALFQDPDLFAANDVLADADRLGSARLQLSYPWVQTDISAALPEGVQSPEGTMAGAVARSVLTSGVHASAAGSLLAGITGLRPELARADVVRGLQDRADWLGDRITLLGRRSDGFILQSDATMADDPAWRAASVSRLIGTILRAGHRLGETLLFENSGEALWARTQQAVAAYLTDLWQLGALDGATPADAFEVRCDRTTMTQADIDAGRLIASVGVTAAQPVQRIIITLALSEGTGAVLAEAA